MRVICFTAYIPVVNVGVSAVTIKRLSPLGLLSWVEVVSLPPGLNEVHGEVKSVSVTSFALSADMSPIQIELRDLDLSVLSDLEQEKVRELLLRHKSVCFCF